MRTRWIALVAAALVAGAIGGALLGPAPVGAVAKEIIQLQADVTRLIQGQRDMQSAMDEKFAVQKTLIEQTLDAVSKLNNTMGGLQKTMQDVQANSGARLDSMSTQVQGLADNVEDLKVRLGKINQQLADLQSTLQSIDARLANPTPAGGTNPPGGGNPPGAPSGPPPSASVLYDSAFRDFQSGKYDLAKQEFSDYLKYYPDTDLAGSAQFWIGEIYYAQKQYKEAVTEYDKAITNYPKGYKLATARYKKGLALLELGEKAAAIRELREVVRRFPGSDEDRRARAKLRELGVAVAPAR